ncbi:Copine-domain-containing protein [Glomus cerebriforme]|uniref:Copine-domain-containing protein n=1 Tax=Glomus cerebriforme TaxID=658196 RepID=A0A397TJX9_9GLOM|nr:Copine-domain-containing protein [Glomus cerebriforme]
MPFIGQQYAHSKVELKISCENLPKILSSNLIQVVLLVKDQQTRQWVSTPYKTEVVDSLNPKFVTGIVVDYYFEELQRFRFVCVNVIKPNDPNLNVQKTIGYFDTDLGSIVASIGGKVRENLSLDDKNYGILNISVEEVIESKRVVKLQFRAHNIVKDEKTFMMLSRANEDGTFCPVYRTQTISSINPAWPEIKVRESTLCNGDLDRALLLQIKSDKGDDVLLGQCIVTLNELLDTDTKWFPLKLPNRNVPKDSRLEVIRISLEETQTFLDYIAGGTQINLVVAIDFTISNGDPNDPNSLHYIGGDKENDYQQAIRSIGTILEQYDSDKKIPVYGFGAKFRRNVSHAYPLNHNFEDPEVLGVDGIMAVYKQTIDNVELYGPTNFSPIINQTATTIKKEMSANNDIYYILLIITDGIITDMDVTVRSIVRASKLPLSIIIVGVGNADFTNMKILDADDKPLTMKADSSNLSVMGKDIVQFVAMREFETGTARDYFLPKAVMEEIPDQFMSYMEENNIKPRKRTNLVI